MPLPHYRPSAHSSPHALPVNRNERPVRARYFDATLSRRGGFFPRCAPAFPAATNARPLAGRCVKERRRWANPVSRKPGLVPPRIPGGRRPDWQMRRERRGSRSAGVPVTPGFGQRETISDTLPGRPPHPVTAVAERSSLRQAVPRGETPGPLWPSRHAGEVLALGSREPPVRACPRRRLAHRQPPAAGSRVGRGLPQ